jgi:hypothetical protein
LRDNFLLSLSREKEVGDMYLIRTTWSSVMKKFVRALSDRLVNLIDISGLLKYNESMEEVFFPAQQALLEDAAQRDLVTARRKLLVEFLTRERYLTRFGLIDRVEMVLGRGCFGDTSWEDVFYRDMRAVKVSFRAAGFDLAYSRNKKRQGYYLKGEGELGQSVARQIRGAVAEVDPKQVAVTRKLKPAERAQQGLSITNLAHQVTSFRKAQREIGHG